MKKIIDGNHACSKASYDFTEVAGIYPITPSSQMAELIDEWSNLKKENIFGDQVKVVQMQSEAGAAGMMHGVLSAGLLGSTYTASQGLLLMIPNIYKMVGEMLPGVIHVSARSLSTHALSIFGDHQDIYATRQTGITMLASSSVQDAYYLALIAHLVAIKSSLPVLHFFDGFRTSHELNKINVLEKESYQNLIDQEALTNFRKKALHPNKSITKGTAQNDDIYFQATEARNKYHNIIPDIVNEYMQAINKITGETYQPFNYYGSIEAKYIIVAMGSVNETIKEVVDHLGDDYGLIEVHLYRPFSVKYFLQVIPKSVQTIAVLDRTKEPGSQGEPLYLDVVAALQKQDVKVVGGRYGLSSKNVTPGQIEAVYHMLAGELKHPFSIGIIDDVTNLSLPSTNLKTSMALEFAIYGYGSDGMVTAAQSLLKIVGGSNIYVQGYFQYDSKKSGGVTVSHLRFCKQLIRSTYYVENPKLIVITKESYFKKYRMLNNICQNGVLLINTAKEKFDLFSKEDLQIIKERNIKVYGIDALTIASENKLQEKISTIMEMAIFEITQILDVEKARHKLMQQIEADFKKKGSEIITANQNAIKNIREKIKLLTLPENGVDYERKTDLTSVINARDGDHLPVSAFDPRGEFIGGTTKTEKREIAAKVPSWISENCIQCNLCAFVCPHAVIRPFHLTKEEYEKAPESVQKKLISPLEKNLGDYYYLISVSVKDCTGCGLCVSKCPGRAGKKALLMQDLSQAINNNEHEVADYTFNKINNKKLVSDSTIKGTQFQRPRFEFSGACAGCGETPYLKLLTQMFGERLIIANATGCSSIYGGTAPSTPYDIPWASSLFEDTAEYGYGMEIAYQTARKRLKKAMTNSNDENAAWYQKWLENINNYQITKEVSEKINYEKAPLVIKELKEYIPARTVWSIGGDGWAYDIGFGGIDHVLASSDNLNMLVLDTQVYSNTGGQTSKASTIGSIASFAGRGKGDYRKDLARIALCYPHAYVAQVSLGADGMQLIKAFKEAAEYNGPALIIAYAPCIAHGIAGGMVNSDKTQDLAVKSGYFPIFRYHPEQGKLTLDSKKADFTKYEEFLNSQKRFSMLKFINSENAQKLLEANKKQAEETWQYYQKLANKE